MSEKEGEVKLLSGEERFWAALAHLSALGMGMGLLLPLIGWSEYRRKSKFVALQSLQALGYQTLGYTLWFLLYLILTVLLVILGVMFSGVLAGINEDSFMIGLTVVVMLIIFVPLVIYLLVPVIGAIACGLGRDFRYPFMGRLEPYLNGEAGSGWFDPEREDRWVASMSHFSVIIMFWSLILPVVALFTQGKRSTFLKFQSLQTLIYQGAGTVGYFGVTFLIGLGGFAFAIFVENNPFLDSTLILIVGLMFFVVTMGILLLLPLFHILGQWAGLRVLQGRDYHYPLIGRLTAKLNGQSQEESS